VLDRRRRTRSTLRQLRVTLAVVGAINLRGLVMNDPTAFAVAAEKRDRWILHGLRLEWLTIAWMLVEAAVALVSAMRAHSLTLLAFGVDSLIEVCSAFVLVWRLNLELRLEEEFSERAEILAGKIAGALLYVLAAYVVVSAIWGVLQRSGQEFSLSGLVVALVAIPTMYWLSRAKLRVAEKLRSPALRADAIEAVACGWLSFVVVFGLVAQLLLRAWWLDAVTSVVIVYFLAREGSEAWKGDEYCK
jgi:divalent metal cation (Fe/Co/Zn/Cd) transporter